MQSLIDIDSFCFVFLDFFLIIIIVFLLVLLSTKLNWGGGGGGGFRAFLGIRTITHHGVASWKDMLMELNLFCAVSVCCSGVPAAPGLRGWFPAGAIWQTDAAAAVAEKNSPKQKPRAFASLQ